jgi:hypothetical protein
MEERSTQLGKEVLQGVVLMKRVAEVEVSAQRHPHLSFLALEPIELENDRRPAMSKGA